MSEAQKIGKEGELADLLVEALATPERLSRFLYSLQVPFLSKEAATAGEGRSVELLALEAIDELRRRGLIDVAFFDRLMEERPEYAARIHDLQVKWLVDVDQWADRGTGRELYTLEGHFDKVNAVAVTPDGQRAVSASDDRTVKVWDLQTGRVLHTLQGHSSPVAAVTGTPDGQRVVTASDDRTLKVWDLRTGTALHTLVGHSDRVTAVAVTPDGQQAVSASDDRTLKVWDLRTGRALRTLEGHAGRVTAVAVTPDGQRAVSASDDRTLKATSTRCTGADRRHKKEFSRTIIIRFDRPARTAPSERIAGSIPLALSSPHPGCRACYGHLVVHGKNEK